MRYYKVKTLNVIVYGMGNSFLEAESYLLDRVNIVGCTDSDERKKQSELAKRYKFYLPTDICKAEYDYIFIVSIYDTEIRDKLIGQNDINPQKIMTREQWSKLIFLKNGGDYYPDQYVYVISRPIRVKNGLFANVFGVINQLQYLNDENYMPVVDMQSYPNIYLENALLGIENVWEYYFDPLSPIKIEDIECCKNILLGFDSPDYKVDYMQKYDIDRMHDTYKKYVHIKQDVMDEINEECNKILPNGFQNVLGVLYRGTDMVSLKLKDHPVQPSVNEMCCLIEKYMVEWNCNIIYLCTEDANALAVFKACFKEKLVCSSQMRFEDTGEKWLGDLFDDLKVKRRDRGLEYLKTIEILSRCDNMIASVCAGSVCAHIMHGNPYKHLLMIDKGKY